MDCFLTFHDIIFHGARCTTLCESKTPLSYNLRSHWDVALDHGQSIDCQVLRYLILVQEIREITASPTK